MKSNKMDDLIESIRRVQERVAWGVMVVGCVNTLGVFVQANRNLNILKNVIEDLHGLSPSPKLMSLLHTLEAVLAQIGEDEVTEEINRVLSAKAAARNEGGMN